MVDFSDRENIKRWLSAIKPAKRRREIMVALAARAALRATPLLGVALTQGDRSQATALSDFVLSSLRATALSWAAAKYPAHGELRNAALAADLAASKAAAAARVAARAGAITGDYTMASAARAAAAASLAPRSKSAAVYEAAVVARGVGDAVAYDADADLIDGGRSGSELMEFPLWPGRAPDRATEAWRDLRAALLAADEGWKVWTEWYEARLDTGHRPNEALEIARATIPDEIWRQGPAVVNAEIKRLIAEHARPEAAAFPTPEVPNALPGARTGFAAGSFGTSEEAPADTIMQRPPNLVLNRSIPPIETIPEQERTGTPFGMDAEGLIDALRIPPAIDDLQRFHYDEMRHKAQQLVGLGQMLGDIAPAVARILEALPEHMEDASVDRLWSRGNTLRRRHDAHVRTIDSNLGPDPAHLHPLVAANLGDFIDGFNVYVLGDPRALELDRIRLGPQDREAARKIVALAAPIARAAGEPNSPTTPAAQEALSEQVDAAIDAPNDINGDQSVELAGKTTGNFVSELLRGTYAHIRKSGAVIREGFYREAGAHAFRSLVDGDHWPEISSFVVHNAGALRAFVKGAFQNPKLVEIIDWIVKATGH